MDTSSDERIGALRPACKVLALATLFVVTIAMVLNLFDPYSIDFISYWAAAVLALDGNPAGAYDVSVHGAVQRSVVAIYGGMPFAYPPPFLILLLPFAKLPFAVAAAMWVVTTFAFYLVVAKRLLPGSAWLVAAFPAVLVNGIIAQNGFLTSAILISGLLVLPRRPFLAGLILGCLVIKPHLGLLLPLAFVAAHQWRAFAGAALSSTGLLLLGLLLFGMESYAAWLAQAPLYASIVADGLVPWHKMASVYASLRLAGLGSLAAWIVHGTVAAMAAATVWFVWRSQCAAMAKGAALAAATALASPYLFLYDTLILIIPFVWLATVERHRALLAVLWCIPLVSFAQSWGFNDAVNLTPVMPIVLLALIAHHVRAESRKPAGASEAAATPSPAALAPSIAPA